MSINRWFLGVVLAGWMFQGPLALASSPGADEKSIALNDVKAAIEAIQATPKAFEIKGTYSSKHLFKTYTAGTHHVQGMTALSDGRFVLTHNSRKKKNGLIIIQTGGDDTVFHSGVGHHPGGCQATGDIIAVPFESKGVFFFDKNGKVLPPVLAKRGFKETAHKIGDIYIPLMVGSIDHDDIATGATDGLDGAIGIVWHEHLKRHILLTGRGHLYKSNGKSLKSKECAFEYVGFAGSNAGGNNVNLLYERGDKWGVHVVNFSRDESHEVISVDHLSLMTEKTADGKKIARRNPIIRSKQLQKYADSRTKMNKFKWKNDYTAGSRWGMGVVVKSASEVEIVAANRGLAQGPAKRYCKAKRWTK